MSSTTVQTPPQPRTWLPQIRIVPYYPGPTPCGLDVWTRVFQLQAKAQFCLEVILPAQVDMVLLSTSTGGITTIPSRGPVEGDANCHNRFSNLLYEWTDKNTCVMASFSTMPCRLRHSRRKYVECNRLKVLAHEQMRSWSSL